MTTMFLSFIAVLCFWFSMVYGQCNVTVFDYEVPTNITNGEASTFSDSDPQMLTQMHPQPFPVKFCTAAYFKTSTKSIYFTYGFQNETDGAIPVVQMTPNVNSGYTFNATVDYHEDPLNQFIYLGVLEEINDYYVPNSFHWYVKQAWISTP